MRKSLLSMVVGLGVLLAALTAQPLAFGQRGSSGGSHSSGRSYSSGSSRSSSSTHSSTSSKSTSGRSYSAGQSRPSGGSRPAESPSRPQTPANPGRTAPSRPAPSGKSYGGGSFAPPSKSNPNRPDTSSPASAPRQQTPASTRPRSTDFDAAAAAAQQREQSREAYTRKSSPTPPPSPGRNAPVHPSGKTYATNGYDSAAAQAQRREQSRVAYQAGTAPKPTYRTPGGVDKPVVSTAPEVQRVRRVITPEVWRTRPVRIGTVYRPYFGYPVIVYNDPYNTYFWYWLLSQSLDSQAYWTYHHRNTMDQRRYDDLLRQNAQLSARVQQLEQAGAPRDTSYVPSGIDPDLMYADDYVDAVYNPVVVPSDLPGSYDFPTGSVPGNAGGARLGHIWKTVWHGLFAMAATFAICFFLIWLIFVKRWGGDRPARAPRAHGRRLRR